MNYVERPKYTENVDAYLPELFQWISDAGFMDETHANHIKKHEDETKPHYYTFCKGDNKIELLINGHLEYSYHGSFFLNFVDYSRATHYSEGFYLGWMGQNVLHTFQKPITQTLFNEICTHYAL